MVLWVYGEVVRGMMVAWGSGEWTDGCGGVVKRRMGVWESGEFNSGCGGSD